MRELEAYAVYLDDRIRQLTDGSSLKRRSRNRNLSKELERALNHYFAKVSAYLSIKETIRELRAIEEPVVDEQVVARVVAQLPKAAQQAHLMSYTEGGVHVYYGGLGPPDGPGHAHWSFDRTGYRIWGRNPREKRLYV